MFLLSCSFWELCMPDSSAEISNAAAGHACIGEGKKADSAHIGRPHASWQAIERAPALDATIGGLQCHLFIGRPLAVDVFDSSLRFSSISVLGVPGYDEAKVNPASYAPRATASFPVHSCFIFLSPLFPYDTPDRISSAFFCTSFHFSLSFASA